VVPRNPLWQLAKEARGLGPQKLTAERVIDKLTVVDRSRRSEMRARALAVIPARGGSKRIPRKNIRVFLGQPIIKYPIDAALAAGVFDEVMVSSDDDEIIEVAGRLGASIPFKRSPETSTDFATTAEVLLEVIREYHRAGRDFDYLCCIYPAAPFINAEKLQVAWKLLQDTGADSAIPVAEFSFPILRSFKIDADRLAFNWPENALKRSQDLPPAYHDCGQFYFLKTVSFLKQRKMVMDHSVPVMVPESETQDIDTEEDWKLAEIKYSASGRNAR
jgi:pseudaminic acid cytidylyltransferase